MARVQAVPAYALVQAVSRVLNEKVDEAFDLTSEAADMGADLVREFISTRGTPKSGKAGRIETGKMLDSVDSQVVERSGNTFQARFGMGAKGVGNVQDYYRYQEGGFRHRNGVDVPGMFATFDAREIVRQWLAMSMGRLD